MKRFVNNDNAVVVHISCDHPSTRIDRFDDEVCRSCGYVFPNVVITAWGDPVCTN